MTTKPDRRRNAGKPASGRSGKTANAKGQSEAFAAWLDRAVPELQKRLAEAANGDVTAPSDKTTN
jgi:hypothetical protein